jgi:aspartate beta-hydroxylase/beta-hydroxylase
MLNSYIGLHMDRMRRPTYFNISVTYPALDTVTKAYPAIRKEFEQIVVEGLSLPQYHEVDSGERAISSTTPKRWNVFFLECLGCKVELNRAR